jgi:hypothetical protein
VSSSKRPNRKTAGGRPAVKPPAAARLTIKPGPPRAGRLGQAGPPRPQPSGSRPLSEVELEEDEVILEGFEALLNGLPVRITAVLERTCVYLGPEGDRRLSSKSDLWVEADKLPIRRRGIG